MANGIYRSRIISSIAGAIRHADDAAQLDHLAIRGRLREVTLKELIEPLLPNGIEAATGVVVDSDGRQSSQIDIIVYSTSLLPSFMRVGEQAVVPVEACIQAIEVKSRLTAEEMRDAIKKAHTIKGLNLLMNAKTPFKVSPIFSLFAFGSDLSGDAKTEMDRYLECKDEKADARSSYVLLNDFCVVGKGYWYMDSGWSFTPPTDEFDEVIHMLAMTANSIPEWVMYRGSPRFGSYIRKLRAPEAEILRQP